MNLGFTATRGALTQWQIQMVDAMLRYHLALGFTRFHHGDCVGGDYFAARCAYASGYWVVCHPPVDEKLRAFAPFHETRDPLPYLERNDAIVRESQAALAVPATSLPIERSGTWSTITKLAQAELPYWVITPDGCWASAPSRKAIV